MDNKSLLHKIQNRLKKLRLQPVRVFCLHHITTIFDATSMCDGDWMEICIFKNKVEQMQRGGYKFISLEDAHFKIKRDFLRFHKYAVLTFDDGYKSLDEILPWLIEQQIPVTLFINGKYTDGESKRDEEGKHFTYLTLIDLKCYAEISNGLISIQSHGYEHLDATQMTEEEFKEQLEKNIVRGGFHAYTWGRHNAQTDAILNEYNIIPVLIDGLKNYNDASCIHRELLDE